MLLKNKKMAVHNLLSVIQEKVYKAKDLGVASRTIYHWKTEGLLFNSHNDIEKNMMTRFSLSEYFWIRVIQNCRDYGMSIKDVKFNIISKVRSYDEVLEEKHKEIIKNVRESLKEESEQNIQKEIANTLKYLKYVNLENERERNHFQEVLGAVLFHRKPSGILIYNEGKIETDIYIENEEIVSQLTMKKFTKNHLYISFDSIFVELGLSDHFKQSELLSNDEISSIEYIREVIKSEESKSLNINLKNSSIKSIITELNKPKGRKEIEEYKRRFGNNLNYKTNMYDGKPNLFDFHYTRSFDTE